jgi:hypothetical protein
MTGTGSGLAKGQRIDRYEIREQIGQGGMGAVYRAVDSKLGRTVALKTVVAQHAGAQMTEPVRQRFLREALAISKIDHRNVVQVLDFGFADDGTPFLVMEFLRGRDLGSLVKSSTEPMAIGYVADVAMGVCAALRACHQANIVHRDLKPSNVFLADTDTGWEVKVLDFGVSKAAMIADAAITEDGQIVGTPQYLSPEQVNGRVGPESDQYAVGVLLYVCLTKRLPFRDHQGVTLLRAIEAGRFEPPRAWRPDLPAELDAIILRAMANDPRDRFESIHALGQKLWDLASPRGRDQWRHFYFQTPPPALAPRESMHALPLVEALVRRGRAADAPGAGRLPGAIVPATRTGATPATMQASVRSTGAAEPETRVIGGDGARPANGGKPQLLISTKLAAPLNETTRASQATVRGLRRRRIAILAGGVLGAALGSGLWLAHSAEPARHTPTTEATTTPAGAATTPAGATTTGGPPSPAGTPIPARPLAVTSTSDSSQAPAEPPALAPPVDGSSPSASGDAAAARRHDLHRRPRPIIDQNGIGIPAN